jgi:hypothetical protein
VSDAVEDLLRPAVVKEVGMVGDRAAPRRHPQALAAFESGSFRFLTIFRTPPRPFGFADRSA